MKPTVEGILESAIYVDDVAASVAFYSKVFGFSVLFENKRMSAMSVSGKQVLLIFKKGMSAAQGPTPEGEVPGHDGNGHLHFAFAVDKKDLPHWRHWLEENGIVIESTVRWSLGGESVYFRDPDNHCVELATRGTWEIY
ncbi:MAG: VOC family protein [bacterium]|nr:VOC family protein [bacterium]